MATEPALRNLIPLPDACLQARCSRTSDVSICSLVGEIDLVTAPVLERALLRAEHVPVRSIVVDLSQVEFLAVVGVRTLLVAARRAARARRAFSLVVTTPLVRRVLDLTDGPRDFACHDSLSDAVRRPTSLAGSSSPVVTRAGCPSQ